MILVGGAGRPGGRAQHIAAGARSEAPYLYVVRTGANLLFNEEIGADASVVVVRKLPSAAVVQAPVGVRLPRRKHP